MSDLDPQYLADLRAGRRRCGDPLCPDPYCWMERDEDEYERVLIRYHDQLAGTDG